MMNIARAAIVFSTAAALLAATSLSYAQDKMEKGTMAKDGMAKEGAMTKDGMKKEGMMEKDGMKKDAMKDGMAKDSMKK